MKRIILVLFYIILFCIPLFSDNFVKVYNCPSFNFYLSQKFKGNNLVITGKIENLYYVPLIDIIGYVDGIKDNQVIEKRKFYIPYIGEWQDVDSKKTFKIVFKKGKSIKKLKFTINFNYASWKESMDNYEYFTVKVSNK